MFAMSDLLARDISGSQECGGLELVRSIASSTVVPWVVGMAGQWWDSARYSW